MPSPQKPPINLLRGWPHPSLLPTNRLTDAATTVLRTPSLSAPALLYGPDEGDLRLRRSISQWLTQFYAPHEPVTEDRITITGGASQNLGCVLQTFTDPVYTRYVWVVAPAYMLAFAIFQDAGLQMRAVPEVVVDEGKEDGKGMGPDVEFLRREIERVERRIREEERDGDRKPLKKSRGRWQKFYKHIVYTVPTFANPSSTTTSLKRRKELVELAREYDALIICDDVYDFLQWRADGPQTPMGKALLPRLVDIDRFLAGGHGRPGADGFGNVLSNGSFSKILGPGVRTGWLEAAPNLAYGVAQTGTTKSGGAPSQLAATFVAEMLERDELQSHVFKTLQPAYERRWRAMKEAIEKELVPLGVKLSPQAVKGEKGVVGGYFIWLNLPVHTAGLAKRARKEENLFVGEGAIFEVPGDEEAARFPNDIRLCFAWEDENKLTEGVKRLADALSRTLADADGDTTTSGPTIGGGEESVDKKRQRELQNAF